MEEVKNLERVGVKSKMAAIYWNLDKKNTRIINNNNDNRALRVVGLLFLFVAVWRIFVTQ